MVLGARLLTRRLWMMVNEMAKLRVVTAKANEKYGVTRTLGTKVMVGSESIDHVKEVKLDSEDGAWVVVLKVWIDPADAFRGADAKPSE